MTTSPRKHNPIAAALKRLYRRLLGELAWIEEPPKTMARKSRDRDKFEAAQPARTVRACEIREDLPHVAHVVRLYDPTWDPTTAKPIRPHARHAATPKPKGGWALATLAALRETDDDLTVAEIVMAICDRHDIENKSVSDRQRCHTAVNNALVTKRRQGFVEKLDGRPSRWSLKRG
jgi:hypothetical protein